MSKKIKILFLLGTYGTGGKEKQLTELIKVLDKSKYDLNLIAKDEESYYASQIKDLLSDYYLLDDKKLGLRSLYKLKKKIKEIDPDIVYSF